MRHIEGNKMIGFDKAYETVMGSAHRVGTERVALEWALGRVLAENVVSDIDMPPFNKSARDGYACRRQDVRNELTVVETIAAGAMPKERIGRNECAKIMTGGVMPEGADCVMMVEHTAVGAGGKIRFTGDDTEDYICLKGEDVKKGEVVLVAGDIIKAQHIAVLASVGAVRPLVSAQPRVGIIATGDELVEPDETPQAGQIRNSNAFQLAAQVTNAGAIATNYGIAVDTEEALQAKLEEAMAENDVVILSGGVSVGDYDIVRGILEKNGIRLLFERVAVKPGRPTVFGVKGSPGGGTEEQLKFVFGLPGNPVSTFIIFELLVKPFFYKMMGHDFVPAFSHWRLAGTITRRKTERDSWLPVVFTGDGEATTIEYHGSAHINALCEADGLLCVPAGVAEIKKGSTVAVRQI